MLSDNLAANDPRQHLLKNVHLPAAFIAAENGSVALLQVLLGPSTLSERQEEINFNAKIEALHIREQLWQFKLRLSEKRLATLKRAKQNPIDLDALNTILREGDAELIRDSALAEHDRTQVHERFIFPKDFPMFPTLDCYEIRAEEDRTMFDFLSAREKIDGSQSVCCTPLTDTLSNALKELWFARFEKIADEMPIKLKNNRDIETKINDLQYAVNFADGVVISICDQKTQFTKPLANLTDHVYPTRAKQIEKLIDTFITCPALIPSIYHQPEVFNNLKTILSAAEIPVNATNHEGNTLLHVATKAKKYTVVKLLIEHGADMGLRNNAGFTAADLAGTDDDDLRVIAEAYQKRGNSQFLADVIDWVKTYERNHKEIVQSIKRYLHTNKRLKERETELTELWSDIKAAQQVPTDESLGAAIFWRSYQASRGALNRSSLFDPLVDHALRFRQEQGYGISNQDVMEMLGGRESKALIADLQRASAKKDRKILKLKNSIEASQASEARARREKQELMSENEKLKQEAMEKDTLISSLTTANAEEKEQTQALQQMVVKNKEDFDHKINGLQDQLTRLISLFQEKPAQQHPDPLPQTSPGMFASNAQATLFNSRSSNHPERHESFSGAIPMDTFSDMSTGPGQ